MFILVARNKTNFYRQQRKIVSLRMVHSEFQSIPFLSNKTCNVHIVIHDLYETLNVKLFPFEFSSTLSPFSYLSYECICHYTNYVCTEVIQHFLTIGMGVEFLQQL